MSKKPRFATASDLYDKIDWEGGTIEALFFYGIQPSDMPKEIQVEAKALKMAFGVFRPYLDAFDKKLERLVRVEEGASE